MARQIVIALLGVGILGDSGAAVASQKYQPTHQAAQAALRFFELVQGADFDGFLRRLRRPAPSPAARAMVIRTLPREGNLTPSAEEAERLASIRPVISFHGREQDIELRLITLGGLAWAGLHARTVLLISREALQMFDTDELRAIVAHELGHDYFWDDYEEALLRRDYRQLQELELRSDGIAVITMDRQGIDSERLVSAVVKLARYNQLVMGSPIDPRYVPLDQRVRFIRSVARISATSATVLGRREN